MEPITIRSQTDTTHPQASIPVYVIHTMQKPLCDRPGCWCQTNKAPVTQLLEELEQGSMLLYQATNGAKGKQA